jgi:transcriptional regulator with XRE-family HTH domain
MSTDFRKLPTDRQEFPPNREQEARSRRLSDAIELVGTAAEVSRRTGIKPSTISGYLNGGEMKLGSAIALAEAAGVRLEWLATGRGPMKSADFPDAEHHLDPGAADQPWIAAARPAIDRLRQAINDAGGPAAVAQRAGLEIARVAPLLQAVGPLFHPDLVAVAAACSVSLDWLATGIEPMKPTAPPRPSDQELESIADRAMAESLPEHMTDEDKTDLMKVTVLVENMLLRRAPGYRLYDLVILSVRYFAAMRSYPGSRDDQYNRLAADLMPLLKPAAPSIPP